MLKTRTLAALVFAPPFLWLVWYGGTPLRVGCFVVAALMLWEFYRLTLGAGVLTLKSYGFVLGAAVAVTAANLLSARVVAVAAPAAFLSLFLLILATPEPINESIKRASLLLLGACYACGLLPYLIRLRDLPGGLALALMALFCTWGADTGAYFAGRLFGRHKLYPKISPGKTVEGLFGGVAAAIGVAFLVRALPALTPTTWHAALELDASHFSAALGCAHLVAIGCIAGTVGVVGDLCESMLKRSVGAKDSSQLIPGHGGILDRFDAVMFVAPALYIFAVLALGL